MQHEFFNLIYKKISIYKHEKVYFRMNMLTVSKSWRKLSYHHASFYTNLFIVHWYHIQKRLCARRECMAAILHSNPR